MKVYDNLFPACAKQDETCKFIPTHPFIINICRGHDWIIPCE